MGRISGEGYVHFSSSVLLCGDDVFMWNCFAQEGILLLIMLCAICEASNDIKFNGNK